MALPRLVIDIAGAAEGGAARWVAELDRLPPEASAGIDVIGRGRYLNGAWLARRELVFKRTPVVAANNVSFIVRGRHRTVLARNALHFVYSDEEDLLARMPRSFQAQVPVVRRLLSRADVIVAPSTSMAERVAYHVPTVASRLSVRAHPVTALGTRKSGDDGRFVLVPIVPGRYKNVTAELELLLEALDKTGSDLSVRITADAATVPSHISAHPRLQLIGRTSTSDMVPLWLTATAVFFPCVLESFGYPLAEARVYGLPVIAAGNALSREVAGAALREYHTASISSLADALDGLTMAVRADPASFAAHAYFTWLNGLSSTGN